MTKVLTYQKTEGGFKVFYENGVYLGDFLIKEDGYYDWWPKHPSNGGYWSSYVLREMADKLDELNGPWEKEIERCLNNE